MTITALPIAVPLIAAALLVATRPLLHRLVQDGAALVAMLASAGLCAVLLHHSAGHPFAYWVGGWRPSHGVTLGIALSIDPFGAGMAAFAALLVCASLVYSVRYFDAANGLFQALMVLFGAGMVGFCLTGDLFDLIVFFELMGAAAYALTAHHVEDRGPIQGAINFAITNSVAACAMFIGVALLYARTGALNMAQIGAALDGHRADALVLVAMALLFVGFMTKAAAVPVHFWLADAHAVAPTPVCVLFSGVMIELGVFALARLYWVIFAGTLHPHEIGVRAILIAIGVTTALLGAVMCFLQRHVKRLLAFSSIGHVGMFLCGVGLLSQRALAGVAVYIVGHGLVKGALFMCAGVLMHRFATIDEYDLHGRGRADAWLRATGVLVLVGGLLLAAAPPFTTFAGKSLLEEAAAEQGYPWLIAVFIIVSALTGGAVLRVAGRVFMGWGPAQGPDAGQQEAGEEESDEMQDTRDHTPPAMVLVPAVLLALAMAISLISGAVPHLERAALQFVSHGQYARWVLHGARVPGLPHLALSHVSGSDIAYGIASTVLALAAAAVGLWGRPLRARLPDALPRATADTVGFVRQLHSGHIGDYIAWWTTGAAALGGVCLLVLR